jgi:hypothetical protein
MTLIDGRRAANIQPPDVPFDLVARSKLDPAALRRRFPELDVTVKLGAALAVLLIREQELLELKGACSNKSCRLHYAHRGPCDTRLSR